MTVDPRDFKRSSSQGERGLVNQVFIKREHLPKRLPGADYIVEDIREFEKENILIHSSNIGGWNEVMKRSPKYVKENLLPSSSLWEPWILDYTHDPELHPTNVHFGGDDWTRYCLIYQGEMQDGGRAHLDYSVINESTRFSAPYGVKEMLMLDGYIEDRGNQRLDSYIHEVMTKMVNFADERGISHIRFRDTYEGGFTYFVNSYLDELGFDDRHSGMWHDINLSDPKVYLNLREKMKNFDVMDITPERKKYERFKISE